MRGRLCSATLKDYENDNNSERVHEFWTSYFDYLIPLVKTRPDFQYIGIVCFKINVVNNEILAIEVKGSYRVTGKHSKTRIGMRTIQLSAILSKS